MRRKQFLDTTFVIDNFNDILAGQYAAYVGVVGKWSMHSSCYRLLVAAQNGNSSNCNGCMFSHRLELMRLTIIFVIISIVFIIVVIIEFAYQLELDDCNTLHFDFLLINAILKKPVVHLLQLPASVLDLYYGIALSPGMLSMAVVRHFPPVDAIVLLRWYWTRISVMFTRNGNVT